MLGSEGKYIFPRYSCVYIPGLSSCRVRIEIHSPLLFLRQSYTRGVGSEWKYLSSSYSGVNQILVLKNPWWECLPMLFTLSSISIFMPLYNKRTLRFVDSVFWRAILGHVDSFFVPFVSSLELISWYLA